MEPAARRITLIASHQDQVVALPDGAELLARGSDGGCPVAGFTVGERAWTLQPHPEFVPPLADHLLAGRVELIGAEKVAAARASLDRPLDRGLVAALDRPLLRRPVRTLTGGADDPPSAEEPDRRASPTTGRRRASSSRRTVG